MIPVALEHNGLRLQVPMNNPIFMQIAYGLEQLLHDPTYLGLSEWRLRHDSLIELAANK